MQRVNVDNIDFGNDYVYRFEGEPFTGIGFELDEAGRLIGEMEFREDMTAGYSREWNSDGTLIAENSLMNNTKHGPQREWSEAGLLVTEEEFQYGFCVRRRRWDDNGKLTVDYEIDPRSPQHELLESTRAATSNWDGGKSATTTMVPERYAPEATPMLVSFNLQRRNPQQRDTTPHRTPARHAPFATLYRLIP